MDRLHAQRNTIILVRHGESTFNRDGLIQGQTDESELTDLGCDQAKSIGQWLNGIEIEKCIASPLIRVRQSAELICAQLAHPVESIEYCDDLAEINFGPWSGRLRSDIMANFPAQYNDWRKRPYDLKIGTSYPVRELYTRIGRIASLWHDTRRPPSTTLVIGHRGTISALVIELLKLPKSHHHFLQVDRASVTIIRERRRTKSEIDYELFCANERPTANAQFPVDFQTEERTKSFGELFLVRHGQTSSNIDRKFQGSRDVSLSAEGINNVDLLSKCFKPNYPARIFSSPLKRAKESAEILSKAFHVLTISERRDLHEFIYGVWEGMSEEDVQKHRGAEYSQWKTAPVDTTIPQAEHINDAYNRCREVWEFYEKDVMVWNGSIISVAHDIVNRLLICNALDLPASYVWKFKQTNASVSVLAVKKTYDGRLRILNHSPYTLRQRLSDEWL